MYLWHTKFATSSSTPAGHKKHAEACQQESTVPNYATNPFSGSRVEHTDRMEAASFASDAPKLRCHNQLLCPLAHFLLPSPFPFPPGKTTACVACDAVLDRARESRGRAVAVGARDIARHAGSGDTKVQKGRLDKDAAVVFWISPVHLTKPNFYSQRWTSLLLMRAGQRARQNRCIHWVRKVRFNAQQFCS